MKKLLLSFTIIMAVISLSYGQNYASFWEDRDFSADTCGSETIKFANESTNTNPDSNGYRWQVFNEFYDLVHEEHLAHTSDSFSFTFKPGIYNVRLTMIDNSGQTYGDPYEMEYQIRGVHIIPRPREACPGEPVNLQMTAYPEYYEDPTWTIKSQEYYGNPAQVVFDEAKLHFVSLTLNGHECGDTHEGQVTVTNNAPADARLAITTNGPFCINDDIKIIAELPKNTSAYRWFVDGVEEGITSPELIKNFSNANSHEIVLEETNACGNTARDTMFLTTEENAKPQIESWMINYNRTNSICDTTYYEIEINASASTYEWDIFTMYGDTLEKGLVTTSPRIGPYPLLMSNEFDITLIVENGCESKDTLYTYFYNDMAGETQFPESFNFYSQDLDYDQREATLCPGEKLSFSIEQYDDYFDYYWTINGAVNDTIQNNNGGYLDYTFNQTGNYIITAKSVNPCDEYDYAYGMDTFQIAVVNSKPPESKLRVFPTEICPGEKVYFWDESENMEKHKYSVYFGDNTQLLDFDFSTAQVGALASHVYNSEGLYNAQFIVKDMICASADTVKGYIRVTPDASSAKQQYFITNSTNRQDSPEIIDVWSTPPEQGDTLTINTEITWGEWQAGMNDTFLLIFYNTKDLKYEEQGAPLAYSIFSGSGINSGIQTTVYANPDFLYDSITMLFAYFCDNEVFKLLKENKPADKEPTVMAPLGTIPVQKSGTINLPPINIPTMNSASPISYCDSLHPKQIKGSYVDNISKQIDIYQDGNQWMFHLNTPSHWMEGSINYFYEDTMNDTVWMEVDFYTGDAGMSCYETTPVIGYHLSPEGIRFVTDPMASMPCEGLDTLLDNSPYNKDNQHGNFEPVCPNEEIDFDLIGAKEVIWDFGNNIKKTGAKATHTFKQPGTYYVDAHVTNKCGRKDTLSTKVIVDDEKLPNTEFDIHERNDIMPNTFEFVAHDYYNNDYSNAEDYTTYLWLTGTNDTLYGKRVIYTYDNQGAAQSYNVRLIAFNGCGYSENTRTVDVQALPSCTGLNFGFDYTPDVANNDWMNIQFETMDTETRGDSTYYFFNFGDGEIEYYIDQNAQISHHYHEEGPYTVCHGLIDEPNQCIYQNCDETIWVGRPICDADFEIYYIDDSTRMFIDITEGTNTSVWTFGDGFNETGDSVQHTFGKDDVYEICLSSFDTVSEHICNICKPVIIGSSSNLCNVEFTYTADSNKVSFTSDIVGDGDFSYWWELGDGTNDTVLNPTHTYQLAGEYEVCLTIMNDQGCVASYCDFVSTANVECAADFEYFVDNTTQSVQYVNKSTGAITDYYWEFGDGKFFNGSDTTHYFNQAGTYTTCLRTSNGTSNCQAEKCKDIVINDNSGTAVLSAKFSAMPSPVDDMKMIFRNKSSGDPQNFYWTFGDGEYNQGNDTVSHKYLQPGAYNICLTVDDFDGTNADSVRTSQKCKDINIGLNSLGCMVTADFMYIINPDSNIVEVSDKSLGNVTDWVWNFGDGTIKTGKTAQHQYSQAGFYLVSLSARDENGGCSDYMAKFIQVGTTECAAEFDYAVNPNTLSAGFNNQSTSTGTLSNFFWLFNDGRFSLQENPNHTYRKADVYNVSLTVSDGLCVDHIEKDIQVGKITCNAGFEVYVDQNNNKAYFTSSLIGESTDIYWSFGDGSVSTKKNPVHQYDYPGFYKVSINTYNNANGCMDYHEKHVLVSSSTADCEADFIHIPKGSNTIQFRNISLPKTELSYEWNFGDAFQNTPAGTSTAENPSYTFMRSGIYNVCLKAIGAGNVENITCKFVQVEPQADQKCMARFRYNIIDSVNRTVKFVDESYGDPNSWSWEMGDSTSYTDSVITHQYTNKDAFPVKLTIENSDNCKNSSYQLVNVAGGDSIIAGFGYEKEDSFNLKASGYPVDFVGISHGDAAKLKWDFGDGSTETGTETPTHVYDQPGEYTVCVEIEDPVTGQKDTHCEMVQVGDDNNQQSVEEINTSGLSLRNYPNPFVDATHIQFTLDQAQHIELSVFKVDGTKTQTILSTVKTAGTHTLIWDADQLGSGSYYLQLKAGEKVITNKMIME